MKLQNSQKRHNRIIQMQNEHDQEIPKERYISPEEERKLLAI